MHPLVWLGAGAVAVVLAWFGLRGGRPRRRRVEAPEGTTDGAFVPGTTGPLAADIGEEEEPFRRRLLPEATGGELGQYGPQTQEQAPSGGDGGELPPGPTQTYTAGPTWEGQPTPAFWSLPSPGLPQGAETPGALWAPSAGGGLYPVPPGTLPTPGTVLAQ